MFRCLQTIVFYKIQEVFSVSGTVPRETVTSGGDKLVVFLHFEGAKCMDEENVSNPSVYPSFWKTFTVGV